MTYIKKITVSNLKAIKSMTADLNGATAIFMANNDGGKSSFITSTMNRLRSLKTGEILKRGESEGMGEIELTNGEKFRHKFNNTTKQGETLEYITTNGVVVKSAVIDIAGEYFPKVFDIDTFLRSGPQVQGAELERISGIDLTDVRQRYKSAYSERTEANRVRDYEAARLVAVREDLPEQEVDTLEIMQRLGEIETHNANVLRIQNGREQRIQQVVDNTAEITRLRNRIAVLTTDNATIQSEIDKAGPWLEANPMKDEDDREAVRVELQTANTQNEAIKDNKRAIAAKLEFDKLSALAVKSDDLVKSIEAERAAIVKKAKLPEGFAFAEDGGILYNGFALDKLQLSSSDIYVAALKLAALTLGEVKTLYFDASLLDFEKLAIVEKWASDNKIQMLIEMTQREKMEGIVYEIRETPAG